MGEGQKTDDSLETAEREYIDLEEVEPGFELPVIMVLVTGGGAAIFALLIRWLIGFTQP